MFEHVDPFIGSAVTDLPAYRAWPPPGGGPSRRSATPIRARPTRSAWSRRARTPAPIRPATGCTSSAPRACRPRITRVRSPPASATSTSPAPARSASTTTTSGSPPCWSRSTPSAPAWELTDEVAEPGYYAATLSSGIRCEVTVGPQSAVHRYTFPAHHGRADRHRPLAGRPGDPVRRDGPAAGAPRVRWGPASPRPRSWSRGRRWPCTWSATAGDWRQLLWYDRRLDARWHPPRLRPDPADHAASVRADVARPDASPARCSSCGSVSRCAAWSRRRRTCATTAARAATAFDTRRGRHADGVAQAPRHDHGRDPVQRAADGLLHRALPLADQAVLRARGEPVLADGRTVRVRPLHDVGHLPHPAAADHRPVPASGPSSWPTPC